MHYLIYKISNRLDNKFYVGKHKTKNKNDDYFGSGLLLGRAVEKHGKENFNKEVLFECKCEEEMNQKESDIVDEDFIARDDTYNIKLGGSGGFDHINKQKLGHELTCEDRSKGAKNASASRVNKLKVDREFEIEYKEKLSNARRRYNSMYGNPFQGKSHSDETKQKMSDTMKGKYDGKNNPNFGNHWITNGAENRLVKREEVPADWRKGRT